MASNPIAECKRCGGVTERNRRGGFRFYCLKCVSTCTRCGGVKDYGRDGWPGLCAVCHADEKTANRIQKEKEKLRPVDLGLPSVKEFLRLAERAESFKEIAAATGYNYQYIISVLDRVGAGNQIRERARQNQKSKVDKIDHEKLDRLIAESHQTFYRIRDLSVHVGCSASYAYYSMKKQGFLLRSPTESEIQADLESRRLKFREHYALHRDRELEYSRKRYESNITWERKRVSIYRQSHPEHVEKWNGKRGKLIAERDDGSLTREVVLKLYRDATDCPYCELPLNGRRTTLDHVQPICKGGIHSISNVVVCCWECNKYKGRKTVDQLDFAEMHRRSGAAARKVERLKQGGLIGGRVGTVHDTRRTVFDECSA